jgi:lipoate---protein ligase
VVANISEILNHGVTRERFVEMLKSFLSVYFNNPANYYFDTADIRAIEKISEDKYHTWEWNYGYSPSYSLRNDGFINGYAVETLIRVHRGNITEVVLNADEKILLENHPMHVLLGEAHNPDVIAPLLEKINFMGFRNAANPWEILRLFF